MIVSVYRTLSSLIKAVIILARTPDSSSELDGGPTFSDDDDEVCSINSIDPDGTMPCTWYASRRLKRDRTDRQWRRFLIPYAELCIRRQELCVPRDIHAELCSLNAAEYQSIVNI